MLKKLSKYGNSTALVIDKAILEILNMNESSLVKLKTDGKSLIISPVEPNNNDDLSLVRFNDNIEAIQCAYQNSQINNPTLKKIEDLSKEVQEDYRKEVLALLAKHNIMKFSAISQSADYKNALEEIQTKYHPLTQSEKFIEEYNKLNNQYCPELEAYGKEVNELNKKYGLLQAS